MAKTQAVEYPDELENQEAAALEHRDRYVLGVTQAHKHIPSRRRKKEIREKSLFGFLAQFWNQLSPSQKDTWRQAAEFSDLTNWQLYISDNAARIRNELPLDVPPSDLWQVRAGRILIESPADGILLKQEHPDSYWTAPQVVGKSWKRHLVKLQENFSLPLNLAIRYKTDLTATSGESSARYIARVWHSIQGTDYRTDFSIDMSPNVDWTLGQETVDGLRGIIVGYTLYLDVNNYRGEILFDNVRAEHSGTNWARDPRADEVDKSFTGPFSVVAPYWEGEEVPEGAQFFSDYPPAITS